MDFLIDKKLTYPIDLSYSKSIKQLGASVKASFPISDIDSNTVADIGNSAEVREGGRSYFQGIITEVTSTDKKMTVTAYDCCYRLNKSKIAIQFDGMTVSDALKELWRYCGIESRHIPNMPTQIESVHYAQSPADIAKKLVSIEEENNGGEYYITSEGFNTAEIYALGQNVCPVSLSAIIAPTKSATLDGVKNHVLILVSDGNGYTVTESAKDWPSIQKYGMYLREYINVSSDASSAVGVAQNRLSRLKRLLAEGNVTVRGDWALTAVGNRIAINEPISGLVGDYVITSVLHKLGDDFQTTLGLKEYYPEATFKSTIEEATPDSIGALTASRDK